MQKKLTELPISADLSRAIVGNIDGVSLGAMIGWVYSTLDSLDKQRVCIYDRELLIANGTADRYRADLEDQGISDGNCAFNIPLPESLFDGLNHKLTAMISEEGPTIGSYSCVFPSFADTTIETVENGILKGIIEFYVARANDTYVIEVLIDGVVALESHSFPTVIQNQHAVIVELPTNLYGNCRHEYSLRVKSKKTLSNAYSSTIGPCEHKF